MEPQNTASATPVLRHRKEFETILSDYQINGQALAILRKTPFVLLVSATASGRNTIIRRLIESGKYHNIISDTTRPKRIKDGVVIEHDGVEYFFRSEDDVLADVRDGKFVEAAIIHNQQVSGVSIREVQKAHDAGTIAITDIEIQGCETIMRLKPDAMAIFVVPPSFEEWLARIHKRSTLTAEEVKNRLESAVEEYGIALQDDRFIFAVNDNLDEAVKHIDQIARLGERDAQKESQAKALAVGLRAKASTYLSQYPNW